MSKNSSFLTPVQEDLHKIEGLIRSQADEHHPDIRAALDLLLSSGGKRVRPTITLLVGRMLAAPSQHLITLGASIELLHTATLVHDDLIDGSLLRRGMPTLNSQWSPAATILTGDFLFARAAKLAADTESIPVMKLFSQTLATIVNGEITQLFNSHSDINLETYYRRIYAKTASLFETSACAAALISPVDEVTVEYMRAFGYEIGMAFQIMDDVLDFTGQETTLGKPVGNDLHQGLITLPSLRYISTHPEDPEGRLILEGIRNMNEINIDHLVDAIRQSDAIQYCLEEAHLFIQRGLASLNKLPQSTERKHLQDLAEYFISRNQ